MASNLLPIFLWLTKTIWAASFAALFLKGHKMTDTEKAREQAEKQFAVLH
ncbi:hypothetical protein ATL17_3361 [Maritalea mobilis]|uniref:Uncharacterized protein n=1 Tax=Maritalea mobilis TaxID=483324 RepID=A0A4R6VCM2_9HYPH|nr:hypothetical protein ATL17_3361 [Maritalea mobilis]